MSTFYSELKAEFDGPVVELERICSRYWSLSPKEAKRLAGLRRLPVPAFKAGSQKSPWLVSLRTLALHLEARETEAQEKWERCQPMAPAPAPRRRSRAVAVTAPSAGTVR